MEATLFTFLWRRGLLLLDAHPLLLLDDELPDVQSSDLQLLYVEAPDPAPLHSERPDRQGAYRECSHCAGAHP